MLVDIMPNRLPRSVRGIVIAGAIFLAPIAVWQTAGQIVDYSRVKGTIRIEKGDDFAGLANITLEEGRAIALEAVPGSTFDEGDLDTEDGYLVYEIDVVRGGGELELLIDAADGSVLRVARD